MHYPDSADPAVALAAARSLWKKAAVAVALFSAGVNLLMLTTPLYMLQVYDRVTTTRNVDTPVALTAIAVLALAPGGFEMVRGRSGPACATPCARIDDAKPRLPGRAS